MSMRQDEKDFHYGSVKRFYNDKVVFIPENHGLKVGDYVKVEKVEK